MVGTGKISRVRTGCYTCRRRRIKCDERRPACDRCRNANFRCEGYEELRSVHDSSLRPGASSQLSGHMDRSLASSSASPHPSELSQRLIEELPWRRTQWRSEQLPLYHHFVTSTVKRLFVAEHASFWRDRVAQISFGTDGVYQALLAVGAAHRASLLACSSVNLEEAKKLKLQGLRAYGSAIKLLAASLRGQEQVGADPETVLIVLLLCTYFECFMESYKSALRHLYAAIQVLRCFEQQRPPTAEVNMVPIYDAVMRLDFLAMKLIPYASSAFLHCPNLAFREYSSLSQDSNELPLALSRADRHLVTNPHAITIERNRLIQLVSTHNKLRPVVWGPWYPISERPSRDELMEFYTALLLWKANSPKTFGSCISDLDSQRALIFDEVSFLPMPPQPLTFVSSEAAVNVVMYNGFLGCALAMLSTTDHNPMAMEIKSYNSVYQNMRICAGLLNKHRKQELEEYAYRPCDSLDSGISVFLYHGAHRCFSAEWQQWTIAALHSIGREGLSNAHALAKTLEIMALVEKKSPQDVYTDSGVESIKLPLGPICERTIPVTIPKEEGGYEAYFLRYGTVEQDGDENLIRLIGMASWMQDDAGNVMELKIDHVLREARSLDNLGVTSTIGMWREKVAAGWHKLV